MNPNNQPPNQNMNPQSMVGGVSANGSPQPAVIPVKSNPNSTQNTLQIAEIRDGVVIMHDGSFRSVIRLNSINFDLMSPQEREGVEYGYQGFLNSLYFPVQIFIRSQKIDIGPYIQRLSKIRSEHENMLLAMLMDDYLAFVSYVAEQTNIMDKSFYMVLPFYPVTNTQAAVKKSKGILSGLFGEKERVVTVNEADLEAAKTELRNRVQAMLNALLQCGVHGLPLDTQELIELYYDFYNPDTATRQKLRTFEDLTAPIVTRGMGDAPQPDLERQLQ